jgi:GAF domain-containing protein
MEKMIDDLREMIAEQERTTMEVDDARRQLEAALEEAMAAQRRYIRREWEDYAKAGHGYVFSAVEAGPTSEAWLPEMSAAVKRGETAVEGDDGQGMTLAVPIQPYGETIGVLGFRREGEEPWTDEQIAMVEAVAAQVGLALESQRLFDQEQRARALLGGRVKELDCLNEIGRRIDESPPIPELLQWVAERIPTAMQYPEACLTAVELEGQVYGDSQAVDLPRQMVGGLRVGDERVGKVTIAYSKDHPFLDEESALLGDVVRRLDVYIESRRLFEQTQQRIRELASLNSLSTSIGAEMRLEELAERVLTQLTELIELDACYLAVYDEDKEEVKFVLDLFDGERRMPTHSRRKLGRARTDYVIRSRQPLLLRGDIEEEKRRLGIETEYKQARAYLGVPMMLADRVIGVLAVQSYQSDTAFDEYHLEFLSTIAGQTAVALERTRLFEQTQAALEEVEATHRRYLERAWAEYLETEMATSYEIKRPGAPPLGDQVLPEMQQAIAQRKAVVLDKDHATLAAPIALRGAVLGALGIRDEDSARGWTADEVALVEAVAERMALAAENLRLLDQTQHRATREQLTREITDKMRRAADIESLLQTAIREIAAALGTSNAFVQLAVSPEVVDARDKRGTGFLVEPTPEHDTV